MEEHYRHIILFWVGVVSVEEGRLGAESKELVLESVHLNRMTASKDPAVLKVSIFDFIKSKGMDIS